MASAAEDFATTIRDGSLFRSRELRRRVLFTAVAIIIYRIGTYIPVPGVDASFMPEVLRRHANDAFGMYDLFTGGALLRFSIFALNILPRATAAGILRPWAALRRWETARTKARIRRLTVVIALLQSGWLAGELQRPDGTFGSVVAHPGWVFMLSATVSLMGGTLFLIWLADQIDTRGVGGGNELIATSGVFASLPAAIVAMIHLRLSGVWSLPAVAAFPLFVVATATLVAFAEQARRRIPVRYPARRPGSRLSDGDTSTLPLRINPAGLKPPVMAGTILLLPVTVAGLFGSSGFIGHYLARGQPLYLALFALAILVLAWPLAATAFDARETADDLRKHSGFVPGIRPGAKTAEFLDGTVARLTAMGAVYLIAICLPLEFLISDHALPALFAGASIVTMVNVSIDTMERMLAIVLVARYDGLIRRPGVR